MIYLLDSREPAESDDRHNRIQPRSTRPKRTTNTNAKVASPCLCSIWITLRHVPLELAEVSASVGRTSPRVTAGSRGRRIAVQSRQELRQFEQREGERSAILLRGRTPSGDRCTENPRAHVCMSTAPEVTSGWTWTGGMMRPGGASWVYGRRGCSSLYAGQAGPARGGGQRLGGWSMVIGRAPE
ncbi:hypothetical protein L226DRAFT_140341 [Lentinus tigrinus ALCF2SS1-7]|uniref:uncharacterized protein n=1 Tax=Lentinus tigrinus ALCF2SS1-7 TaxID=1328758 RepID=UPI0011662382|nr:hypothetical protein L226DRAFT_140341 [Lentinus tigrinus ALCF2SS1-7]